ncbi:hypothetical protein L6164_004149 [Bauhinia variegata]|uniref:Uncharacterized protein n=1 Tax=Bauhinia variegata TaxID=167791 RepID=A0ACB9Q3R5_BAUVA|nr:hypothetical protein L6164_004149 [Bauhinia variegata]
MMGTSSTSANGLFVDELYFSALYDSEVLFPISDEKYAEELQLQEALISSAMSTKMKSEVTRNVNEECDTYPFKGKKKETGESSRSCSQSFCQICTEDKPAEEMFRNQNCAHSFCTDCVGRYVGAKIQENISSVKCPEPKCRGVIEPQFCRSIIPKEVFDRWEDALSENLVLGSQKFYCPFNDCSALLVDDGGEVVTSSECPNCRRLFCAQCRVPWHAGVDCREFQNMKESGLVREDLMVMELAKKKKWTRCPNCKFYVEKVDGCNHISCRGSMMATSSSASDNDLFADEFYLSALYDEKNKETAVESSQSLPARSFCEICLEDKPAEEMLTNQNCAHSFCTDCIRRYVGAKIQENISFVKCPEPKCRGVLEPQFCQSVIPKEVFDRWEDALCENLVLASQKFYCPSKDCLALLVADGDEVVTSSECPNCRLLFCAQCRVPWHARNGLQGVSEHEREWSRERRFNGNGASKE